MRRLLLALLLTLGALPAAGAPRRVVSLNLCTDQLALALAAPGQLVSITWLARDRSSSALWREAAAVPMNHGLAEEIIPLRPDLVLAGTHTTRPAVAILRRIGVPVAEFAAVDTLDAMRAQIREMARVLDRPAAGEEMLTELDRRLAAIRRPATDAPPVAAVYQANGVTVGDGSLVDNLLRLAGFDNLAPKIGLKRYAQMPTELLVLHRPDLLIVSRLRQTPSLAEAMTRHRGIWHGRDTAAALEMPPGLWSCGGLPALTALELLAAKRRDLAP
jgi:iron complex transport system substrate-binding protein